MESLLQLRYSRETNFMGKRSESRLTKDGWDTFMKMKFKGENQNGWSFPSGWWQFIVNVIVSLHISLFRWLLSLLDATVLLTLLLLSLTGKLYKNIGECDLLPFAMVEVRIKHHQFCLLSHFSLKRQWSKHSYRKWKLRYWRPLCAHSDGWCTVESMGDQK